MNDQAEALRRMKPSPAEVSPARIAGRTRCIAVTSGKGGVGKTNLAVNLGIVFAARGLRAGVLDADLGLANVDIVLGLSPPFNLGHVLYGEKRLEEIVLEGPKGLRVLAGGSGLYELANLSQWRLERFIRAIGHLDRLLDVLLIDTGAGISRNVLSFALAVDEVIVVTTPEPPAVTDAYGVIKVIATKSPHAQIHLVVNMAKDEREADAVHKKLDQVLQRFLQVRIAYLGYIPSDPAVSRSVQVQEPLVLSHPTSRAARSIAAMADQLLGGPASPAAGVGGLFRRMAGLFR